MVTLLYTFVFFNASVFRKFIGFANNDLILISDRCIDKKQAANA